MIERLVDTTLAIKQPLSVAVLCMLSRTQPPSMPPLKLVIVTPAIVQPMSVAVLSEVTLMQPPKLGRGPELSDLT